ncbi:MAG: hypothetical protein P1V35_10560 [Planctomycetota bacterium]|nr:hypothetical protein [Planctomycetota bacterium]
MLKHRPIAGASPQTASLAASHRVLGIALALVLGGVSCASPVGGSPSAKEIENVQDPNGTGSTDHSGELLVYEKHLDGEDGGTRLAFKIEEVVRVPSYSVFLVHFLHKDLGPIWPGLRMMEQAGIVARQRGAVAYGWLNQWDPQDGVGVMKVGYFDSEEADLETMRESEMDLSSDWGTKLLLVSDLPMLTGLLEPESAAAD